MSTKGRTAWLNPAGMLIGGFLLGAGTIFLCLYLPSQRLLAEREKALTDMARFNREEQGRIAELRDISTGEMQRWLALTEKVSTKFEAIQQHLFDQERQINDSGAHLVWFVSALVAGIAAVYILAHRREDMKDSAAVQIIEARTGGCVAASANLKPLAIEAAPAERRKD